MTSNPQSTNFRSRGPPSPSHGKCFTTRSSCWGFRFLLPANDRRALARINGEVTAALEFYGQHGWLERPQEYFAAPPTQTEGSVHPVTIRRRAYERLVFDSGYEPRPGEPGRDRWLGYTANNRESALVLRHREPRPWVVCVHGALMGRGAVDLRLFRAQHLHDDLGLNVVLPVLPLHGRRKLKGAAFPGEDVLDDVHAAAQAVWDIRRILSWIRAQEPESPIGLNSMSLGGTSLHWSLASMTASRVRSSASRWPI